MAFRLFLSPAEADAIGDMYQAFEKAVRAAAKERLEEFGFRLTKFDAECFTAESAYCRLAICLDRAYVDIQIQPHRYHGARTDSQGLLTVLSALAPELGFQETYLRFPDEVGQEVDRQIALLVRYCEPMFHGDMTPWEKVQEHLNREPSALAAPPWSDDAGRIRWVRADVVRAFRESDYVDAYTDLSILIDEGVQLTPEEERMLDYTTKWLEGSIR